MTFAQRGLGDVLPTWENEAFLVQDEFGKDKFDIVVPKQSILAEPPVTLVDGNVDKDGNRKLAEAYLQFLYSDKAQATIARHHYRPLKRGAVATADLLPEVGVNSAASFPVSHDINLEVQSGELLALLGPSGCGKTTLLRIIAGLEVPDRGRIVFAGADTTRVPVQKREVGFVFQHYALFKHLTIADNIAYGLHARRRRDRPAAAEIKRRVEALLDLIKLGAFHDRYPSQLSGGQRQRVALARALAVEPRVLLLDELDAQVRKDLRRWLRDIHQRTGQTTIFVTHDQDEALELSDRVAVMHAGRLEQVGTPHEAQDRPASVAVLRFLGDALEVEANVVVGAVAVAGRPVPVSRPERPDGPVTLFVRPWQLERAAPDEAHVSGVVRNLDRSQGRAHLSIDRPDASSFEISLAEGPMPNPSEPIGLRIVGGYTF